MASQLHPDVFINFRGKELRGNFISHLVAALDRGRINYYLDRDELRGETLDVLYTRIEESKIALAIFSKRYGESNWCLNELGRIMREVEDKNLKVIPVFFNVTPNDVAYQVGEFGTNLTQGGRYDLPDMMQWRKDLNSVVNNMGICFSEYRDEHDFIENIIAEVKRVLQTVPSVSRANMLSTNIFTVTSSVRNALSFAAVGRIAQSTKVLAKGGYEKIFRQTFETVPEEQLLNYFSCYLSTSAGPVMGVLYISTAKLAYCSDNLLSYENGGQTVWSYFKVVIPIQQLNAVNPSESISKPGEKYIEVISVDNKEHWFMDFLNYEGAVTSLQDSLQAGSVRSV